MRSARGARRFEAWCSILLSCQRGDESKSQPLAVQAEEHERTHQRGPLVPVDERMIPSQVEEIGSRHPEYAGMQILVIEGRLRHRDRGPEQLQIAKPARATIHSTLIGADPEHLFEVQEGALAHAASRRNTPP